MQPTTPHTPPHRCGHTLFQRVLADWGGQGDFWVFAYASLIWRPEGTPAETRPARVHGHHRALHMWSRVNRGTPECPGLVFALIAGGSCQGVVQRISGEHGHDYLHQLWAREMPNPVYDPVWLPARTPQGTVRALAFTLSRHSPSYTGLLPPTEYRRIFNESVGRYGSTLDYARQTHQQLAQLGIHDRALQRLLNCADDPPATPSHRASPLHRTHQP